MPQFINEVTTFNDTVIFNGRTIFNNGGGGGSGALTAYDKQVANYGGTTILLPNLIGYNGTSISIEADPTNNGGDHDANLYLTSADAGSGTMSHMIYATADNGLRINYNLIRDSAGWHHSNPAHPYNQFSFETDGALGLEYTRPLATPAGAYDSLPGKSWKLYPGGRPGVTVGGQKDKYIFMTSCEPGRGFDFGVEIGGTGSTYGTRIRIDDSSNANPIFLYVAGALRQVLAFNDGMGHNVLYY